MRRFGRILLHHPQLQRHAIPMSRRDQNVSMNKYHCWNNLFPKLLPKAQERKYESCHLSSKPAVTATKHRSTLCTSNAKSTDAPITPTDVDVLFGRGGNIDAHNTKFREQVRKYVDRYQQAARDEKTIVSTELVNSVKGYGGRFPALDNGSWYEVDDKKAKLELARCLLTFILFATKQLQPSERGNEDEDR
eukprot:scaffold2482_cov145-Skeletonema_dohrnii-CCMP3373.AAC.4